MTPVEITLPAGAEIYNYLMRSTDPAYLVQDILSVRLSNGNMIEVGWFPEHDPTGEYVIRAFDKNDQHLLEMSSKIVDEVKWAVETYADLLSRDVFNLSASNSSTGCAEASFA
jgi:hypothetical protein